MLKQLDSAQFLTLASGPAVTSQLATLEPQDHDWPTTLLAKLCAQGGMQPAVQTTTTVMSTALEASKVLKAAAGKLHALSVFNSGASAQFILVMNSATVPVNGAVTLLYPPIPIAAGALVVIEFTRPLIADTGISVCNSSTGSFTKTLGGDDCVFHGRVTD